MKKRFNLFILMFFLFITNVYAAQVTLQWDANEVTPDGYKIFQRTSGGDYDYSNPAWQGTALTTTISNLDDNTTYYYVARAYKGTDESGDSNEVKFVSGGIQRVLQLSFTENTTWSKKTNIEYFGTTNNEITISWSSVPEAEGYEIRLFHVERNVENIVANGKTALTQITFKLPRTGHYIVKVRACVNNYINCNDWSESINSEQSIVDGTAQGWIIYGHVSSPGPIVIE